MMKKNKIVALLCLVALCAAMFAGCKKNVEPEQSPDTEPTNSPATSASNTDLPEESPGVDSKEVTVMIEGVEETIKMNLNEVDFNDVYKAGPVMGIYVDEERYEGRFVDKDYKIVPIGSNEDSDVSMTLSYIEAKSIDEYAQEIMDEAQGKSVTNAGAMELQYCDPTVIIISDEDQSTQVYLLAVEGGVFALTTTTPSDSDNTEGHMTRLNLMAETFFDKANA